VVAAWPVPDAHALGALRVPVLLIAGGEDAGSVAAARVLAGLLDDARLEIVPGAGHVVNLAAPAVVGDLLRDWLDRLGDAREIPSGP
jgi:pimeloyl-ACP methyl ester carboxylesterase